MGAIQKILIANRGEIAVRIIQTAQKLGIKTVAVFASDDANSQHVHLADESVLLEGNQLQVTYLNQEKIIQSALTSGAQAIHPGYGFLSENAEFAVKVEQAGLTFIGATAEQIRLMGEKTGALTFVRELGIPVIPGMIGTVSDLLNHQDKLEFPLLVKASGGGGGKGMEVVHRLENLPFALQQAQRQAQQYFGNGELFVEKYLSNARHIEVQVLGDGRGNAVHFFERECSIQRRYQKLIEEAPARSISADLKEKLYGAALKITRATTYRGVGTIEFLVDGQQFYFLEMNTRLQVEHPVTELITGSDLVEWQLKIAAGEKLDLNQQSIAMNGHAIELRICAEDPLHNFKPTSGVVGEINIPSDCRWDSFLQQGAVLSPVYDSLVGKLIVHDTTRESALLKIENAVCNLHLEGLRTNQEFLHSLLVQRDFQENLVDTRWLEMHYPQIIQSMQKRAEKPPTIELFAAYLLHHFFRPTEAKNSWEQTGYWRMMPCFSISLNDEEHEIQVLKVGNSLQLKWNSKLYELNNYQFNGTKIGFQLNDKDIIIFISEEKSSTGVYFQTRQYRLRSNHVLSQVKLNKQGVLNSEIAVDQVVADLFGKVIDVLVKPGDVLRKGQNLLVIESMKSEFTIQSPANAVVKNIHVAKGTLVQDKQLLVDLES